MNYQNEPNFNDVYSRNNLPKINYGAYAINIEEYKSIGTPWIALYVNSNNVTYFDSFAVAVCSWSVWPNGWMFI